jgi:UPF0716 family protein affecting phage T7 exclusion
VRVPLGGAGLLTLVPGLTTDAAGFALALIVAGAAWLRARFAARATAAAPGIRDAGAGVEGLR